MKYTEVSLFGNRKPILNIPEMELVITEILLVKYHVMAGSRGLRRSYLVPSVIALWPQCIMGEYFKICILVRFVMPEGAHAIRNVGEHMS